MARNTKLRRPLKIAFFGSSLVSAYWNGAATYYRGLLKALAERGHETTFYEPDAYDRQKHRDIADPAWARVVVYANHHAAVAEAVDSAADADLVVKASGVGVFDDWLAQSVLDLRTPYRLVAFWDVDAPATIEHLDNNPQDPLHRLVTGCDVVFTYGGGPPVVKAYNRLGAPLCVPIYNAVDPETHHPAQPNPRFMGDLGFIGNRLPDREARVEEFFFKPARLRPHLQFVLGGAGWDPATLPRNVRYVGHVYTALHNSFNASVRMVLNVHRDSMARTGYSPATRLFEAAGAGACLLSDACSGLELFLQPNRELLVAHDGDEVVRLLDRTTPERAARMGARARRRILAAHTYRQRAVEVDDVLGFLGATRPLFACERALSAELT